MNAVTHEDPSPEACLKTEPVPGFRALTHPCQRPDYSFRGYTVPSLVPQMFDRVFRAVWTCVLGLLPRQEDGLEEVAVGLRTQAGLGSYELLHVAGEALQGERDRAVNIYM